ncbi:hypothetical protein HY797_01380 [Candidatus Falkowbacteria bacterium]|nr:hypothetical protein [Candidatus Falkowbacteria bacterium]
MNKVIDLSTFKNKQLPKNTRENHEKGGDLTELLKKATILRQEIEELKETVVITDFAGLRRIFETRLSAIILKTKNIEVDFFLCGSYIASLLAEIGNNVPESWFAIDYLFKNAKSNNPNDLKRGANVCFLICSVFPKRSQIRCMKYKDYQALGRGLYYNYYGQTGKAIAYFMSKQFQPMVEITKECLRELK